MRGSVPGRPGAGANGASHRGKWRLPQQPPGHVRCRAPGRPPAARLAGTGRGPGLGPDARPARNRSRRMEEACAGQDVLPVSPGARVSVLRYLVSDSAVLREHWEQAPFVCTDPDDLGEIFALGTVERLIHSG